MTTTTTAQTQVVNTTHLDPEAVANELGGKYLTFKLGAEIYGVQILKVHEIISSMEITFVPKMPDYVRGVINLRGSVVPVISLRAKFGLEQAQQTDQTCIIVIDVGRSVGIVVDSVQEVVDIGGEEIEPPPPLTAAVNSNFILGMAKSKGTVRIILNIDEVLDIHEIKELADTSDQQQGGSDPA